MALPENWRALIETEARTWLNTPFVHKARVKGVGVDCGGIIYQCFAPYLPLPPFPDDYAQDWSMHKDDHEIYLSFIAPFVREVPGPTTSGLALFHFGRNFSHGAICTARGTFIHAYGRTGFGAVIESGRPFFSLGGVQRPVKFFDVATSCIT